LAILRRNGQRLHYEVQGAGVPILGIHGSPGSSAFWEAAAARLARLGRCILYDRRGYHRSAWDRPPPAVDLTDQIDDIAALLEEVDGAPAVVIGRSTGGQIALALAVRRPDLVQALVLLEPAVFSIDPRARRWAGEIREEILASHEADPDSVAHTLFDLSLGPETWEAIPAEARDILTAGGTAVVAEINGRGLDLSTEPFAPDPDELASVLQPALVLTGQDSLAIGRAVDLRLAALLPHARHLVVPGGHLIHPAHTEVLGFISDVLAGQASVEAGA
jgi:pimeloyl-ACP methyl ester carboxylesterase